MEVDESPPSYEESCQGEKGPSSGKFTTFLFFNNLSSPLLYFEGDWETLWMDTEKWNLVIKQLEDCVYVNSALRLGNFNQSKFEEKESKAQSMEENGLSLEVVLSKGTGNALFLLFSAVTLHQ